MTQIRGMNLCTITDSIVSSCSTIRGCCAPSYTSKCRQFSWHDLIQMLVGFSVVLVLLFCRFVVHTILLYAYFLCVWESFFVLFSFVARSILLTIQSSILDKWIFRNWDEILELMLCATQRKQLKAIINHSQPQSHAYFCSFRDIHRLFYIFSSLIKFVVSIPVPAVFAHRTL